MNFGLLFQKWSLGTQESFCKVLDQLDTQLNNYGLISWHTSSINCVNNCRFIFTRHQPRLFLKALLVWNVFALVDCMCMEDVWNVNLTCRGHPHVPGNISSLKCSYLYTFLSFNHLHTISIEHLLYFIYFLHFHCTFTISIKYVSSILLKAITILINFFLNHNVFTSSLDF